MAADVRQWLEGLGLGKYAAIFERNEIDLDTSRELSEADLKELGIPMGPRKKLLRAIDGLPRPLANRASRIPNHSGVPADMSQRPQRSAGDAERRLLTIMFCDLVGSTELSRRLDPEDLRELIGKYQDTVSDAVTHYGGHVAKFLGDGVLAYFGWPQAFEDQAERAARAALAAVRAVTALRSADGSAMAARSGIATGQVVVGDLVGENTRDAEAVTGETPNLASRLQSVSLPGQVVVCDMTRRMLGRGFNIQALAEQHPKGFDEAVTCWRIVDERPIRSRFEAHRASNLGQFVGRQGELSLLLERWQLAKGGEGQTVLIGGESGIGKSRLVETFGRRIEDDRHFRVQLQASPLHTNTPFYAVIQSLIQAVGFDVRDDTPTRLNKLQAFLERDGDVKREQFALYGDLLGLPYVERWGELRMTPQEQKRRTIDLLTQRLLSLAQKRPLLFIIEDAHWSDPTGHELMDLQTGALRQAPVLRIITHRPEWQASFRNHVHVTTLQLTGLGKGQGREIARAIAAERIPEHVIAQIVARTDGIPLFVEELTKSVLESGTNAWAGDTPATLQGSLLARLDRLGGEAKELAQIGAVIGREFSFDLFAAVASERIVDMQAALDRLVDAELVFRLTTPNGDTFRFKHAMVQDIAYDSMLKTRRAELHARIAEFLETRLPSTINAELEVLARHYSAAGRVDRAIKCWRHAGNRAAEASANIEAASHYLNAIELLASLPESRERDRLELDLQIESGGPLLMTKGHGAPEVGSAYGRAQELCLRLGDTLSIVPALFGMWRFFIGRGDCTITQELGAQILAIGHKAEHPPARVLGRYGLGFAMFCSGDPQGARRHLDEGCDLYDRSMRSDLSFRLGQDPGVACLSYSALASWVLGFPDQAKARMQEALDLADELAHPFSRAYSLSLACQVMQLIGEADKVRALSEEAIAISEAHGFSVWIASPMIFKGWSRSQRGEGRAGTEEARRGVAKIVEAGMEMRRPYYLALVAEGLLVDGQYGDAISTLTQALEIVARTDERWSESELLRLSGEIDARQGFHSAEAKLQQSFTIARAQNAKSWELRTATSLARLWQSKHEPGKAAALLRPVYDWFTEGFDTPDLRRARMLLDELHR